MSASSSPAPARRLGGARIAAVVVGTVLGLASLACFVGGAIALWADGHKDDQGFVSTRVERFHTPTAALRTDNLDVDLGGTATVLGSDQYGKVRVRVTPRAGKDVFVGIAPSRDVTRYLRGTAHTTVTDLHYAPFHADYAGADGSRRAARPAAQRFWLAQAHGHGAQTVTWDVQDGTWSVVVMNADGSPGVDAGVRAGTNVPLLGDVAWGAIGVGAVLLVVCAAFLYGGTRGRRRPRPEPEAATPLAAAA